MSAFIGATGCEAASAQFYGMYADVIDPKHYPELDAMPPNGRPAMAAIAAKRVSEGGEEERGEGELDDLVAEADETQDEMAHESAPAATSSPVSSGRVHPLPPQPMLPPSHQPATPAHAPSPPPASASALEAAQYAQQMAHTSLEEAKRKVNSCTVTQDRAQRTLEQATTALQEAQERLQYAEAELSQAQVHSEQAAQKVGELQRTSSERSSSVQQTPSAPTAKADGSPLRMTPRQMAEGLAALCVPPLPPPKHPSSNELLAWWIAVSNALVPEFSALKLKELPQDASREKVIGRLVWLAESLGVM